MAGGEGAAVRERSEGVDGEEDDRRLEVQAEV